MMAWADLKVETRTCGLKELGVRLVWRGRMTEQKALGGLREGADCVVGLGERSSLGGDTRDKVGGSGYHQTARY